jgi:hypothetical protein
VERRFFNEDIQRHFVGEIIECTEEAIRLKGYTWVFDAMGGRFARKPEKRERIIPLGVRLTINVIPPETDLDAVQYVDDPQRGLLVTDEGEFSLEITEFGRMR